MQIPQTIEELAIRFAILVALPKDRFSGREQELSDVHEELWDRFGGSKTAEAIAEAKETLKLVIPRRWGI